MKIYVAHSSDIDFKNELYFPLRNSALNQSHQIILPHELSDAEFDSRTIIPTCDVVVAEVSIHKIGVGIELGWADAAKIPIICIYKQGTKPSGSLKVVSHIFVEYLDSEDMIKKVHQAIKGLQKE